MSDDPDATSSCAACGAHRALGRYVCCGRCTEAFVEHIAEIAQRYPQLDANPGKGGDDAGRGAPGFHSQPPGSVHIMAMRDDRSKAFAVADDPECEEQSPPVPTFAVLYDICRLVIEDREFTRSGPHAVRECCEFLDAQSDWIARDTHGSEYMRDVKRVRDQLRRATGVRSPRPIGKCIEYVDDERMCLAPIYMPEVQRGRDESVRDMPPVQCAKCGSVYDGRRLIVLRLAWEQAA